MHGNGKFRNAFVYFVANKNLFVRFYNEISACIFGKFSAVIGPTLFGIVAQATGVSRYGILPVLGMFILGGVIMVFVVPKKIERIH